MIGLLFILLFWLYLVISKTIVDATVEWAEQNEKNTFLWGSLSAFVMFNVLFWDLIPVYGVHGYKCATEGGLKVYKTIDEWNIENPGVAETLDPDPNLSQQAYFIKYKSSKRFFLLPDGTELVAFYDNNGKKYRTTSMKGGDGTWGYWLNQRFARDVVDSQVWDIVHKRTERIIDTLTREVQAEEIEFYTSMKNPIVHPAKQWRDYKVWLQIGECDHDGNKENWLVNSVSFSGLSKKYKYFNGEK